MADLDDRNFGFGSNWIIWLIIIIIVICLICPGFGFFGCRQV